MQHLEEGTIHSWLDGVLSADEAAQLTAHAAECPRCAAAVAEARGFIAASSRILTALDHVPRGVVPAVLAVKWYNRGVWRAAAAVLVIAAGSLVAVRNTELGAPIASATFDTAYASRAPGTQSEIARPSTKAPPTEAAPTATIQAPTPNTAAATPNAKSSRGIFDKATTSTAQSNAPAREHKLQREAGSAAVSDTVAPTAITAAVSSAPQTFAPTIRIRGASSLNATSEQPPLKVVGTPRMLGAKVTLYEVAPGDTVTFTEPLNSQLGEAVTTVTGSFQPIVGRAVPKSAGAMPTPRADSAVVSAPDAQQPLKGKRPAVAPPSAATSPSRVEVANGVTIISWPDPNTGNMLKLSGRMPVERLKEIKLRIERERAAAATKKNP